MIRKLQIIYRKILTSIALLPAIIGLLFFLMSISTLYLDFSVVGSIIKSNMKVLLVKGNDNARQVLGALISGILSLTVFSFSMVMVVVNQASSQFTPRIIPGILTDKKNQFILGFYVGTIIYCIVLILNIDPSTNSQESPQIGILLAMIFGIICIALFIYFIHLISLKIQVGNIISQAANKSIRLIEKAGKESYLDVSPPDTREWFVINNPQAGYLSEINEKRLKEVCRRYHLQVESLHTTGTYLLTEDALCKTNRLLEGDSFQADAVLSCFIISDEPYGENNYLHGINQITEIAVKAMSPGINDPGTAIIAIDYLTKVLACLLQSNRTDVIQESYDAVTIVLKQHTLSELIFNFVAPIRDYGKLDAKVHLKILNLYARILQLCSKKDIPFINQYLIEEVECIKKNINTPSQQMLLLQKVKALQL